MQSLQDASRSCLDSEKDVSDAQSVGMVKPQDEDVLKRLKETDNHAHRNVIAFRESLIAAGTVAPAADNRGDVALNRSSSASHERIRNRLASDRILVYSFLYPILSGSSLIQLPFKLFPLSRF